MKCRFPILINCKGRQIYVPCNHCAWCLSRARDEWVYRMRQEALQHPYNYFLTFTYRDEDLKYNVNEETGELVNTVSKHDVQEFHRSMRKKGNRFRFLIASEYGPKTLRPHLHGIYFADNEIDFEGQWPYGDNNVQLPASVGSFKYVLKYMLKGSNVPEGADPNFRLMSLKPGIGSMSCVNGWEHLPPYLVDGNVRRSLPRFYKKGYYKSICPEIVEIEQEKRLDYLAHQIRHSDLIRAYETSESQLPFEEWLWILYGKDYKKQIQINQK